MTIWSIYIGQRHGETSGLESPHTRLPNSGWPSQALWPVLDIFVQKVLECKYQLHMNLIDLLDIERPQKDIKRPKKAMKVVKTKSKARGTMVSLFCNFFTFLGSLGPNRMENVFTLNSKTKKATRRPLDSRT